MKNLIKIGVASLCFFVSFQSVSQIEEQGARERDKTFVHNTKSKHALGLAAGSTTGLGLSYLYMPDRLCFQVAFLPYKDQESSLISTGLTFIYRLKEGEKLNFLLYQGNHLLYREQTQYVYPGGGFGGVATGKKTKSVGFNNGIGIGFEFFLSTNVSFNLMCGYAGYNNFERITIAGEGALFYKF